MAVDDLFEGLASFHTKWLSFASFFQVSIFLTIVVPSEIWYVFL